MAKLTDLTLLPTPDGLDLIHVVDVSDTTDDPNGSSRKATLQSVIDALASGDAVDSVNGQVGVVSLDTDDISDSGATNKYATAAEKAKLSNITVTQAVDLDTLEASSHAPVTVTDSAEIDFTLAGQDITATLKPGSIDESKLDASTNVSLGKADTASQPGHTHVASNISDFSSAVAATASVTANTAKNSYPSGDATKMGFISVTQAVNLDTMESDIATNNAKVSNATHTGEVTGATVLTIANDAVVTAKIADNAVTLPKISATGTRDATTFLRGDGTFAVPSGGGSGITRTVVVTSGNVTAGASAVTDYVYLVAGAHTVTLPTAVGNTNLYTIKNNHSAAVNLATTSSQTVDGVTSPLLRPEQSLQIISNGTNWNIV